MFTTVDQLAKAIIVIMHKVALLRRENSSLYKANKALSKRRRAKRTYIQLRGSLTI